MRKDDKIILLCKGADSTIYERLDPKYAQLQQQTTAHLEVVIVIFVAVVVLLVMVMMVHFYISCSDFCSGWSENFVPGHEGH